MASRTLELQLERSRLVTVVIREEHDEAESSAALPGPATAPEIIDEMGSDGPVDGAADLDAGSTDAAPGDAGTEDPSVMPCGHSVSDTTTLGVCRADGSPTIDGHLDEYVDSTSVRIDLPEASAVVRLSWDCERLYVGGEIFDRQLWSTHIGHDDASLWNTDSIELLLDVDHDETDLPNGDDRHIIVTATGSRWDARGDRTGWDPALELLGIEQQTRLAGTLDDFEPDEGWRVELAIPWDGLGMPSCPPVGTRLGADVALNQERRLESSGDRQWLTEDWAGLESYANPDGWRDLVLLDSSGAP